MENVRSTERLGFISRERFRRCALMETHFPAAFRELPERGTIGVTLKLSRRVHVCRAVGEKCQSLANLLNHNVLKPDRVRLFVSSEFGQDLCPGVARPRATELMKGGVKQLIQPCRIAPYLWLMHSNLKLAKRFE